MAAPTKVAPPIPARKQSASALSSTSTSAAPTTAAASMAGYQTALPPSQPQQTIALEPLFPADSGSPIVYVHSTAEGQAQTAFGGPPAVQPALPPPMSIEPPENLNGTSVYDITDKDVDNFRSEVNLRQVDEGENYWLGSTRPRNFKLLIMVICCISCALCLWPFSCICLFCASKFNERTSDRSLEKDYVSSWSCMILTLICIILAVCSAIICPIIIISVSICRASTEHECLSISFY